MSYSRRRVGLACNFCRHRQVTHSQLLSTRLIPLLGSDDVMPKNPRVRLVLRLKLNAVMMIFLLRGMMIR